MWGLHVGLVEELEVFHLVGSVGDIDDVGGVDVGGDVLRTVVLQGGDLQEVRSD